MSDLTIIRISNATFYAHHGVMDSERTNGGKFEIDAELECNVIEAEMEDDLRKTIDYEKVYAFIKEIVSSKKFYLIEALALRISRSILDNFERVRRVTVKVRKPSPPLGGVVDFVEVQHTEVRS